MGQRAVIVIDTDYMSSITDDPSTFVTFLRNWINKNTNDNINPFGIRYVEVQHTTSTMIYKVSPDGITRKFPDEE